VTASIDLYVIVERSVLPSDEAWLDALSMLSALDVPGLAVQVRARQEPPQRFEALAAAAREATRDAAVPVLLNGDTATALGFGFDGVHWPEAVIPDAPETSPALRGASVHSPEACVRAEQAGASFALAGAVFDAGSKPAPGRGLEALAAIANATRLPVLAVGGVTPERVSACLQSGATGVAVVTHVLHSPDMAAAVRDLREALDTAAVPKGAR
jgi:thiamine-phosphate diphosphorylase